MKRPWAALLLVPAMAWGAGQEVRFPGPGIELVARLYLPEGGGKAPAVVLLHGCSGMWTRGGQPTRSYDDWAEHLRREGFVALLVDSFGPRGEREICTQKERRVSPATDRPRDAHAALSWLAARPDVDPASIHLLGWSNGAQTTLHALRTGAVERPPAAPRFRSAVAFYPGCAAFDVDSYAPHIPLLILAGGADDWTPADKCERLAAAARKRGAPVEIEVYPGAHHAFDRIDGTVRRRPDVRNPSSPTGWGATVGPQPEARAKSRQRALAFLKEHR